MKHKVAPLQHAAAYANNSSAVKISSELPVHFMPNSVDYVPSTVQEILNQVTLRNPMALFITICMGFPWMFSAMQSLAPAYMSSNDSNFSFITIQNEFNFSDSSFHTAELSGSAFFIGNMVLGQIYCVAADRVGRSPVLSLSLIVMGTAGVLGAFAPSFSLFLVARFLQGSFSNVISNISFVLCCESIALNSHAAASRIIGIFWAIGYCIITPIAILSGNWRNLQFFVSLPCLLFGAFMFWTIPESLSFLVSSGNHKKATKWIEKAHRYGKVPINANVPKAIENEATSSEKSSRLWESLSKMLKMKSLRINFIIQSILWFSTTLVYTALIFTARDSGGDFSFVISGLAELPVYFFLPFFLDKFGRKPTFIGANLFSAGAMVLLSLNAIDTSKILRIAVWQTAKFLVTSEQMTIFIHGSEVFPTEFRSMCLGLCGIFGNLASALSPHCFALNNIFSGLMFGTFAALCIFNASLATLLPETKAPVNIK